MNSTVERLRDGSLVIQHPERKRIADLIEQQAERIKELEAERDAATKSVNYYRDIYNALRQRIDDAPKKDHCSFHGYRVQGCKACSNMPISKEDLK